MRERSCIPKTRRSTHREEKLVAGKTLDRKDKKGFDVHSSLVEAIIQEPTEARISARQFQHQIDGAGMLVDVVRV